MNFQAKKFLCFLSVFITSFTWVTGCLAIDKRIVWQRMPISINLPVGKERIITFPSAVKFGYNVKFLPSSIFRVQNDDRTLYLLAKHSFKSQRVEVKLANGEIILMDICAGKLAKGNPVDIILPRINQDLPRNFAENRIFTDFNYVSLIRYAIQQLYAPKHFIKRSITITRFPIGTSHVVPLFYDNSVIAMPLASWRDNSLYVTAILLKNTLHQILRLSSQMLCGDWKAVSYFPKSMLLPLGSHMNEEQTTIFTVSSKPFSQAVRLCMNK